MRKSVGVSFDCTHRHIVQQQKLNPEIGQPAATVSEVTTTLWLSKNRPMIMIMIMIMMIIIIIGPATDSTKFL